MILKWADAHFKRTGRWPTTRSGIVPESPRENWPTLDHDLRVGARGLPGGDSLARMLARERKRRNHLDLPRLNVRLVLRWADAHHQRTGEWPSSGSGLIPESPGERWSAINSALNGGARGFAGGDSLARLLARERNRRNHLDLPKLSIAQVLRWADAHFRRTGEWPQPESGLIIESGHETWGAVNAALNTFTRGLHGHKSLPRLLYETGRKKRLKSQLPKLTLKQVLDWADSHHARTGRWPSTSSGVIPGTGGESWDAIRKACIHGGRGLARQSLAQIFAERRGVRRQGVLPKLTYPQVLEFVGDYLARTGRWPSNKSGAIPGSGGEKWAGIDYALKSRARGLTRHRGLVDFLTQEFGRSSGTFRAGRFQIRLPYRALNAVGNLSEDMILDWARAHHQRTGAWPTVVSGPVHGEVRRTWAAVDRSLRVGTRGLRKGSSIARLLALRAGVRNYCALPPLTIESILRWADEYFKRAGRWPHEGAGPIPGSGGESWKSVVNALRGSGNRRGLREKWTLDELLVKRRGKRSKFRSPKLDLGRVRQWVQRHFERTGRWPQARSEQIPGSDGDTWNTVDYAMSRGNRGLRTRKTLAQFVADIRGEAAMRRMGPLNLRSILLWARAFHRRNGRWPDRYSGKVFDAPDEKWIAVDAALRHGWRGLKGGTSLKALLAREQKPKALIQRAASHKA
ncbi:MAG TPA: hypothetical protein VNT79_17180 [Phycisphaerae bacterium]|nr:hypothetical protein [Phycisphaerae bacterium]